MDSSTIKLVVILTCAGALGACSSWPKWLPIHPPAAKPAAPASEASDQTDVVAVLRHVDAILQQSRSEQKTAYRELAKRYKARPSGADRMRLALLDALLPHARPAHATALLKHYDWQQAGPGYASLATIMLNSLAARREAEATVVRTQKSLVDEREQREHLKSQLDALKAIEKSLNSRGHPVEAAGDGHG